MRGSRLFLFSALVLLGCMITVGFSGDPNAISKKNVAWKIPRGFPKPNYNFKNNAVTPERFKLGRALFYDPLLSRDSTVSCATCHQSFAAFAHIDHKLSHGIDNRIGTRNVPALQNLIWKTDFMWDGGVNHLEVQPINPITNKDEMDESLVNVIAKLERSAYYKMLFRQAYGDTGITTERILKSLAQFTGLMISANSKYDQYMRKEVKLTEMELKGLELFNRKCNSCHTAPLFTNNSFADNGIKPDTLLRDIGRGKITGKTEDDYRFKVPSLRNVEVTYPYMHDGRFSKLMQVLNHYRDLDETHKTKDAKLAAIGTLSDTDKVELVAFLRTLTDKSFLYDRRFMMPR